jgi:membrane protease YdiL (CAAX protease family)
LMTSNVIVTKESTGVISRFVLVVFCLAAGVAYRASVSLIPPGIFEDCFLLGLAALLLTVAVLTRRSQNLSSYWEIPFAFFVFTIAGFAGDVNISPLQQGFVRYVLHETPSANNPLASTVLGTVLVQLFSTLSIVLPIILLTKVSGSNLKSVFIDKARNRWALGVGIIGFLVFYLFSASGRAQRFFPNNGVPPSRFLALTPALIVLVLCNGLREEVWFRALFLKKYGTFLSPLSSNMLAAIIFASFHVQVTYTPALLPFLGIAFVSGLFYGYLMQKSGSVLASAIFHAGMDIPIFLVYLSYAST